MNGSEMPSEQPSPPTIDRPLPNPESVYYGYGLTDQDLTTAVNSLAREIDAAWKQANEQATQKPKSSRKIYKDVYEGVMTGAGKRGVSHAVLHEAIRLYHSDDPACRHTGLQIAEFTAIPVIQTAIVSARRTTNSYLSLSSFSRFLGVDIDRAAFEDQIMHQGMEFAREIFNRANPEEIERYQMILNRSVQRYAAQLISAEIGVPISWVTDGVVDRVIDYVTGFQQIKGKKPTLEDVAEHCQINISNGIAKRALGVLIGDVTVNIESVGKVQTEPSRDKQFSTIYTKAEVDRVIALLPEDYQGLVRDYFIEGLSSKEIAQLYNISREMVSDRIKKAVRMLRHRSKSEKLFYLHAGDDNV